MDAKTIEILNDIEKYGRQSKGKRHLVRHLNGEKLTRKEAMDAACYDCMSYFVDGQVDCELPNCPMFGFRPYKK